MGPAACKKHSTELELPGASACMWVVNDLETKRVLCNMEPEDKEAFESPADNEYLHINKE